MSDTSFSLFIAATVPGLAMAAAHWFPWHRVIGRELSRPAAYAIGTTAIVGTGAGLLLALGYLLPTVIILTCAASAGLATLGAYAVDHWSESVQVIRDWEDKAHAHGWSEHGKAGRVRELDSRDFNRAGAAD